MGKRMPGPTLNANRKNRLKVLKVAVQLILLAAAGYWLFHQFVDHRSYEPPDKRSWTQRDGYIALSYFGLERTSTAKLLSREQLNAHLGALYDHGYVAISQQDVIDFHTKGAPLPDKALFLAFEDGRNDSALFAQRLLEKYNYRATMMTYADKIGNSQRKFLQPKELLRMEKTGFWELGSNGYRLTYINIFDRDGRYVGIQDEQEVADKNTIEYYNHYLMDFIRDAHMIPLETRAEMEQRINADYDALRDGYTQALGRVPGAYMIMHANALYGGMNRLVGDANDSRIRELFALHFNREGAAYNAADDDVYNLTRIQPLSYWSTNHLLMRIRQDSGHEVRFVGGNERQAEMWTVRRGAAEFTGNQVVLTSPPGQPGLMALDGGPYGGDMRLSAQLGGNVVGRQTVYVRYAADGDSFVRVVLENNVLYIETKRPGENPVALYARELDKLQWSEEDLRFDKASVYSLEQAVSGRDDDDKYPPNIRQTRTLDIELRGNALIVKVDKQAPVGIRLGESFAPGDIALEARYHEDNEKDDIYDGVFANVRIERLDRNGDSAELLFSSKYSGVSRAVAAGRRVVNDVIDWVIRTF